MLRTHASARSHSALHPLLHRERAPHGILQASTKTVLAPRQSPELELSPAGPVVVVTSWPRAPAASCFDLAPFLGELPASPLLVLR